MPVEPPVNVAGPTPRYEAKSTQTDPPCSDPVVPSEDLQKFADHYYTAKAAWNAERARLQKELSDIAAKAQADNVIFHRKLGEKDGIIAELRAQRDKEKADAEDRRRLAKERWDRERGKGKGSTATGKPPSHR